MAQIFHPAANTLARLALVFLGFVGPLGTIVVASAITRSSANTKVGVPVDQPAPFSHEHHSVELGIDCRYCHTSVEKSSYAGVPPTETCMSCHSQIWTNSPLLEPVRQSYATGQPLVWNQLHAVPEFVYFPHNIHINRGVSCNNGHGPIQKEMLASRGQAFFMVWCLNCHRQPEKFVADRNDVWKLYQDIQKFGYAVDKEHDKDDPNRTGLTPREASLAQGSYTEATGKEEAHGKELLNQYHVKKEQLTDCWTCHR